MNEELRRDFETWLRSDNPNACIDRCTIAGCNCGEYILERVEYKWEGYQAGRADLPRQLAEVTAERNALKDKLHAVYGQAHWCIGYLSMGNDERRVAIAEWNRRAVAPKAA